MKSLKLPVLILLLAMSFLEGQNWELSGYVKNLQSHSWQDNLDSSFQTNLLHLRLNTQWSLASGQMVILEGRHLVSYGEASGFGEPPGYFLDLSSNYFKRPSVSSYFEIDRFLFKGRLGPMDYSLGRQRVNWGVSSFWNPNDIFNSYDFTDVDYEERPGSDGLDLEWFIGKRWSLRTALALSKSFEKSIGAAMLKANYWKYDFQLLAGKYREDLVFGTGWAGAIINAGFKGEISYFYNYENPSHEDEQSLSASLGADYFFHKPFYIQAAVLYNSQGIDSEDKAMEILANRSLSPKNLMPTAYNLMLQVSWTATPLLQFSGAVLFSPGPNALFLMPSVNYSLAQNWSLSLIGQSWSFGPIKQYENVINTVYGQIKWSF